MIMKTVVRPETEMKESGLQWLGEIPNGKYQGLGIFFHLVVVIHLRMKKLEMKECILCMEQMV